MYIKLIAIVCMSVLLSCNANENGKVTEGKETTTSNDIEAEKKALNDQSHACIALMNALEVEQKAAYAAGDAATAKAISVRIDSAATENAKIGQKLMALEK